MNTYFAKKTVGFYFTVAATVLAVIGLVFYQGYAGVKAETTWLIVVAIAVEVLLIAVSGAMGNKPIFDFAPSLSAILLVGGVMVALPPMIDGFGYLVSGLFTFDDMRGAIFFLGFSIAALLFYLIPSFMSVGKE